MRENGRTIKRGPGGRTKKTKKRESNCQNSENKPFKRFLFLTNDFGKVTEIISAANFFTTIREKNRIFSENSVIILVLSKSIEFNVIEIREWLKC